MSKIVNLTALFFGAFLLVFCLEGLGDGCDVTNCTGSNDTGEGKSLACNTQSKYNHVTGKCVQKDQEGSATLNCLKSSDAMVEAHCDDCVCSYKNVDEEETSCKCRHKDS